MKHLEKIGRQVKILRVTNGDTQKQLASKCGVTENVITYIERGKRGYRITSLFAILDYYSEGIDFWKKVYEKQPVISR